MAQAETKACELCPHPAIHGERFCKNHKRQRLCDMQSSGYLTRRCYCRRGFNTQPHHTENEGNNTFDNVVRAAEEDR